MVTKEELEAAQEVYETLLLMMGLGGLEIEMEWRKFLAEPLGKWNQIHFDNIDNEGTMKRLAEIGEE